MSYKIKVNGEYNINISYVYIYCIIIEHLCYAQYLSFFIDETKLLEDCIKEMPQVSTFRPLEKQSKSKFVRNYIFMYYVYN